MSSDTSGDVLIRDGAVTPFDAADIPTLESWNAGNRGPAVILPPDAELPDTTSLDTILVAFPSFTDGRGFSIARQLRNSGFTGTLIAAGELIPDQHLHALQVGFDAVAIPADRLARHTEAAWHDAVSAFPHAYQRGYARQSAIPNLRHPSTTGSTKAD